MTRTLVKQALFGAVALKRPAANLIFHSDRGTQDAKSAGPLGFMTRSLAMATLPHRTTADFRFVRRNGDFP